MQSMRYEEKRKAVAQASLWNKKYRNSEMLSLRYEENRKAEWQRRQEQSSTTLYRKNAHTLVIFLYEIKGKETIFIVK